MTEKIDEFHIPPQVHFLQKTLSAACAVESDRWWKREKMEQALSTSRRLEELNRLAGFQCKNISV